MASAMDLPNPDLVQLTEEDENYFRQLLDSPSQFTEVDRESWILLNEEDDQTFLRRLCTLPLNHSLLKYLKKRLSQDFNIRNLTDYFKAKEINLDGSYLVDHTKSKMVKKTVLHKFIEYNMNITDDNFSSVSLVDILNLVIKDGSDAMEKLWQMPEKKPAENDVAEKDVAENDVSENYVAENDATSPKKAKEIHSVGGISPSRVNAVSDILFSTMWHEQFPELSEEDLEGVIPP